VELQCGDNEKVIVQGEKGDTFYIIMSGRCDVFVNGENVHQMSVGDFFGERAILTKEKRSATIQVPADFGGATLLCLDQESFEGTLGQKAFDRAKNMYMKIQVNVDEDEEAGQNVIVAPSQLEVLGSLGEGEFGSTKLVKDKGTKKTYALKSVNKTAVIRVEYHEHPLREKEVLMHCSNCLFVQKMICSYRSSESLNFVLQPCIGGILHDLYFDEAKGLRGNEANVKFHVACVALALNDVHAKAHAIHRGIRAENFLLDEAGFALLGGFDFAKKTICRTYTFCGAPECLAPEVVSLQSGYGRPVDWWALGIAMFELTTGTTPFANDNPMTTYKNIKAGHSEITWPGSISPAMKALMIGLLNANPKERMGIKGKWVRFASQDWWNGFSWDELKSRKLQAPWKPNLKGPEDLSCFDQSQKANPPSSHGAAVTLPEGWDLAFGPTDDELEKDILNQNGNVSQPPLAKLQATADVTSVVQDETGTKGMGNNGVISRPDEIFDDVDRLVVQDDTLRPKFVHGMQFKDCVPHNSFMACCCSGSQAQPDISQTASAVGLQSNSQIVDSSTEMVMQLPKSVDVGTVPPKA